MNSITSSFNTHVIVTVTLVAIVQKAYIGRCVTAEGVGEDLRAHGGRSVSPPFARTGYKPNN